MIFRIHIFFASFYSFIYGFYIQQSIMYRAREEKYESRIRLIETLATATNKEVQVPGIVQYIADFNSLLY